MADATCATCPAYCPYVGEADGSGSCRAMPPTIIPDAPFPSVLSASWCMQHPLRRRHLLALHAMTGLAADPNFTGEPAPAAYRIADGMLAEAAKPTAATPTPEKTP